MSVIWSEDFSSAPNATTADAAYSSGGLSYLPTNWAKFSDTTNALNGMAVGYAWNNQLCGPGRSSSTWGDQKTDTNQRSRGWVIGYSTTGSGSTGPNGAANDNNTIQAGGKYLLLEATSQGASSFSDLNRNRGLHLIRTNQIDLTSYSSTEPLVLKGKYHAYGADMGAFGVAVTTHASNAGAPSEAFTGSGFTGYTNNSGDGLGGGGCDIDYASGTGGTTINVTNKKRIVGSQQTSNAASYNNFEVDMTGAGGSQVYIYFLFESQAYYTYRWNTTTQHGNSYYRADFAVDKLSLETTTAPDTDFSGKIFAIQGSSIAKIYGEDLDEGDKVSSTDGSGTTARSLDVIAAFDGPGSFYGTVKLRLKLATNTWVDADEYTYTNQDNYQQTMTGTGNALYGIGTNFAIWHTGYPPGGNFTVSGTSVTNTSGNFTVTNSYAIGTTHYILGTWSTPGIAEIEVEWES